MDWGARVIFVMFLSIAVSTQKNDENITESSPTTTTTDHGHDEPLALAANDGHNEPLALAANELGYKLVLQMMKHNADSNIVISPTGIAGLLAMTLLGTAGSTYDELASTLGFSQDILLNRANHEQLGELLNHLNSNSSKTMYAGAIFVDAHTQIRHMYREYLKRVYRGEAVVTRFGDGEQATHAINEWVKNNTNGIIEDFLKEPLPLQTKVVLLSALYFSGQWEHPFVPNYTAKMKFKSPAGDVIADLMLNYGEFQYIFSVEDDLHMIALPYNDSSTTMYVLKPRIPKRLSLTELMGRLNYTRINHLITKMTAKRAIIRFPKMEITSSMALEDSLKVLGLNSMFSPRDANFALMVDTTKDSSPTEDDLISRISSGDRAKEIKDEINRLPNPGIYVDTVLHDVKISINEYGTEAVAATSGILARSAEEFYANSPFYMFIKNEKTQLVTFSAVIFNPTV